MLGFDLREFSPIKQTKVLKLRHKVITRFGPAEQMG